MEIRVVQGDPTLRAGAWPHYCRVDCKNVGLSISGAANVPHIFCPRCGDIVAPPEPPRRYDRVVRPETYAGPRCAHGHPDVPCVELARADIKTAVDLLFGTIRAARAAQLAARYEFAPRVLDWVRPCPDCRSERAEHELPVLRHELQLLAKAVADDMRTAQRTVHDLRGAAHGLREAMAELDDIEAAVRAGSGEPTGFVYLIGQADAVKIEWSAKHPRNGRLSGLQVGTPQRLELLGLLVGPYSLETELHERFTIHRIRGEWFARSEEILAYFKQNGIDL